ncbi:hypothetical protein OLMES_0419 [Oleiphilus messinensis]|uniref:Lipoprotein n=1 Tax=Oleiphilus messinensis TaxID=141451 RepID=A0A1Y0I537_9GAMM|nr:hypothetical protein [Oleiphilus messinensis]ARU54523.1 hypothetical protein OLMES_0419 [Oleiphilus messinensis]
MTTNKKTLRTLTLGAVMAAAVGCAALQNGDDSAAMNNNDLYEVHHEGRIFVFDDFGLYQDFLKLGETPYTLTRIGAGPKGETIKFGLTSADKKKQSGIASVDLVDGKLAPAEAFYGEMRMEGRIYVFDNLEDMQTVRKTGEAPLRYTQIGTGPKGETVVYVLNSSNKKKKPVALIEQFNKHNS